MKWRTRYYPWFFIADRTPNRPAFGPGQPARVGQPMGLLLALTYSDYFVGRPMGLLLALTYSDQEV